MNIGVVLASIKPYELAGKRCVDSLYRSAEDLNLNIYFCGNHNPNDSRVIFFEDRKKNGELSAMNQMTSEAIKDKNDYILYVSDDYEIRTGLIKSLIPFVSEGIISIRTEGDSPCFLSPFLPFPEGGPFGKYYDNGFLIPPFPICRFPFATREFIESKLQGYIWHPSILSGYADNYLGYFLALNNISLVEPEGLVLGFMEHIHSLDSVSRREPAWINRRSESCIVTANLISNYKRGDGYVS